VRSDPGAAASHASAARAGARAMEAGAASRGSARAPRLGVVGNQDRQGQRGQDPCEAKHQILLLSTLAARQPSTRRQYFHASRP